VFAARGHILVGLPPFDPPDADDPDGFYAQGWIRLANGVLDTVLLDPATGALNINGVAMDESSATIFDLATEADSCVAFTGQSDGAAAVLAVRSLLESRAIFPTQFTIVLDPELV
jgi:hypothetical protein